MCYINFHNNSYITKHFFSIRIKEASKWWVHVIVIVLIIIRHKFNISIVIAVVIIRQWRKILLLSVDFLKTSQLLLCSSKQTLNYILRTGYSWTVLGATAVTEYMHSILTFTFCTNIVLSPHHQEFLLLWAKLKASSEGVMTPRKI